MVQRIQVNGVVTRTWSIGAHYTGEVCHCHLIHGDLEEVQMLPGKLLVVSMKYQVLTENNYKKEKAVKR
jgi:hypothetical protein